MSTGAQLPFEGALDAVVRIEATIAERDAARERADSVLSQARAEADRLLAAARAAGVQAGEARRARVLAEATADADQIRADAADAASEINRHVAADLEQLVAQLAGIVLPGGITDGRVTADGDISGRG